MMDKFTKASLKMTNLMVMENLNFQMEISIEVNLKMIYSMEKDSILEQVIHSIM
jgi:hypothetical protein